MTSLPLSIAFAQLMARKRQTAVSIGGVMLGVAIFIGIGGLMNGFHNYLLSQLIDTNPHIVISDEFRDAATQPLVALHPDGAVEIRRVLPRDPVRGVSGAAAILEALNAMEGVAAAPSLTGQVILRRAGRDYAITGIGVDASREERVTDIVHDMVEGSFGALTSEPNGLIIGRELADKMGVGLGDSVVASTTATGQTSLKIVGVFHTGIDVEDQYWGIVPLTRQQAMQNRPRVVNQIHIRLDDVSRSIPLASRSNGVGIQGGAVGGDLRARPRRLRAPGQDHLSDHSSILVVAGFGIFNVISTIVMEKARDIAILRSIGMPGASVVAIFVVEGIVVGVVGMILGWLAGWGLSGLIHMIPAPTGHPGDLMPIKLTPLSYVEASVIALLSAIGAAWLPARKAARADPLTIIRGAA